MILLSEFKISYFEGQYIFKIMIIHRTVKSAKKQVFVSLSWNVWVAIFTTFVQHLKTASAIVIAFAWKLAFAT